eukprot:gene2333-8628_t
MPTALQGAETIADLVAFRDAEGYQAVILAGGGVTEDNVGELVKNTGVSEVHSTAKSPKTLTFAAKHLSFLTKTEPDGVQAFNIPTQSLMEYRRPGMSMCAALPPSDWSWGCAEADRVRTILQAAAESDQSGHAPRGSQQAALPHSDCRS